MNDRQLSQLRLQSTVEGLCALAMGYISKALLPYGWPLTVELTTALSIPLVFLMLLLGLRHLKKTIIIQ